MADELIENPSSLRNITESVEDMQYECVAFEMD